MCGSYATGPTALWTHVGELTDVSDNSLMSRTMVCLSSYDRNVRSLGLKPHHPYCLLARFEVTVRGRSVVAGGAGDCDGHDFAISLRLI